MPREPRADPVPSDGLANNAPVGLYRTSVDGTILAANDELARMLGHADAAAVVRTSAARVHHDPADRAAVLAELAADPARTVTRELRLVRRDGAELWVRDRARARLGHDGRIEAIDGALEDITEARRHQTALAASEARYRGLVEDASDVIYVFDAKGVLLSVNDAVRPLFGYEPQELLGRSVFDLIDPGDAAVALKHHQAKLDGREERSVYDIRMRGRDGASVWVEISSQAVRRDGRLVAIHGVLRDLRIRKAREDELLRTKDLLQDLFRNANDVLYTHDLAGNFLSANAMACKAFGYVEEDFLRLNIKDLVDPAWLPKAQENLRRKVEGVSDRSPPYELLCRARDGAPVWLEVSSRLLRSDGRPTMVSGIARDITHRKWADAQLKESELRHRTLFERVPVGLFRSKPDGTVEDANPALLAIMRAPDLAAFQRHRLGDLYERPADRLALLEQLEADGHATFEVPMRRLDGSRAWIRGSSRAIRGPDGQVAHFEGHIEDVTAEHDAGEGLRLVQAMAGELERASDFAAALGVTVRRICDAAGWAYGEAWVPSEDGSMLVCSEAWFTTRDAARKFRHLSQKLEFRPGEGIPGLVWQERQTVWRPDLALEPRFARASAARAAGFRTLVAVPVQEDDRLVAVLMFLHTEARTEDVHWVNAVGSIAAQLGSVMARRHTEDVLRRHTRLLQAHLETSPEGVLIVSDQGEVVAANERLLRMCEVQRVATTPAAWGSRGLLQSLDDPERFQARVRFLYEDPGEGRDELVVLGRRYQRSVAVVRDADDLPWGRIWTFRDVTPVRRLAAKSRTSSA